ncbi:MAG: epoxyqueuosine reductase QueH [Candidatus Syntrophosphaera sp.]|nr:epoxyqueuosine reductase QueH [Candidatus Syntrophosphaera sp.]
MSVPENLLIHTCCAPCLIAPQRQLQAEGIKISVLWYNPFIQPYTEFRSRLSSLEEYCAAESIPLIVNDEYDLRGFVGKVSANPEDRCELCYRSRLEMAAKTAEEQGFDAFTSTLLYSKYQKHELIIQIAEAAAKDHNITFFYRDWRPLWSEGIRLSKEANMYRQKYCGCIFSEEERYLGIKK